MGGLRHTFVSGKTDSGDTSLIRPLDWNNTHSGIVAMAIGGAVFATTSTSYVDVTGLTWAVGANQTWRFSFDLLVFTSATGVGVHIALNGPTIGAGTLDALYEHVLTATTWGTSIQTGYDSTSGQPATGLTTATLASFTGKLATGATAGTAAVRIKAEAAGTVTLNKGSGGVAYRIA